MKTPYKHLDLPRNLFKGYEYYVPPKARRTEEIARRRGRTAGTLVAEHQRSGLRIAEPAILAATTPAEKQYLAQTLAPTFIGTAWHALAQHARTQRSELDFTQPRTPDMFAWLGDQAASFAVAVEGNVRSTALRRKALARSIGNSGLALACDTIDVQGYPSEFSAHVALRDRCIAAVDDTHVLAEAIGVVPSVAQLADNNSPLSVHIRRTAPDAIYNAFVRSSEVHAIAC